MTRLDRIIKGFNDYDRLVSTYIDDTEDKELVELVDKIF